MPLAITPTFRPWTHTSDDSYIYQLSLVLATATVSFWHSLFFLLSFCRTHPLQCCSAWSYCLFLFGFSHLFCFFDLFSQGPSGQHSGKEGEAEGEGETAGGGQTPGYSPETPRAQGRRDREGSLSFTADWLLGLSSKVYFSIERCFDFSVGLDWN